ncbi:MAG: hypothetical protein ACOC8E_00670 [Planctomycetota bacterium]
MARRDISERMEKEALGRMLRRCARPGCRRRGRLGFLPLARPVRDPGQVAVLCRDCLARARAGEFSARRLQLWLYRGRDYWENVGAE